jgi:hypothetical protein
MACQKLVALGSHGKHSRSLAQCSLRANEKNVPLSCTTLHVWCGACAGGGRGAAKTHLPTNEATLKQLAQVHQLPALVLEHRWV